MKTLITLSSAASALIALATLAHAEMSRPGFERSVPETVAVTRAQPRVTCEVNGSPAEFPNDLVFVNNGSTSVPAGATFQWSIPTAAQSGSYKLPQRLDAGQGMRAWDILKSGVEAGRPCTVRVRIKL